MQTTLAYRLNTIQATLFPFIEENLGPITEKHRQLVVALDFSGVEAFIRYPWKSVGRPPEDRAAIARAYIAKAVYNLASTSALIDRLKSDPVLRRLCGWETRRSIPSESTFSRAFKEFAESHLASHLQEAFIAHYHSERLIGHISRDATAIKAREKATPKPKAVKPEKKKKGRPKKGEMRPPSELKRLERQRTMNTQEMIIDLPTCCDIGTKINSKGYKESWRGYKLHMDIADGDIPVTALLTAASVHDSQAALPLSRLTGKRVTYLYELMDSAYDASIIRENALSNGHVPLIDFNRRSPKDKRAFAPHEAERYKERSAAERVNSNLKDNYGGRFIRVRGHAKVFTHLMFGLLALTIDQTIRLLQ